MLAFVESTWPIWWILAIVIVLRWFHVNALTPEDADPDTPSPDVPAASSDTSPQAI